MRELIDALSVTIEPTTTRDSAGPAIRGSPPLMPHEGFSRFLTSFQRSFKTPARRTRSLCLVRRRCGRIAMSPSPAQPVNGRPSRCLQGQAVTTPRDRDVRSMCERGPNVDRRMCQSH